ncbi:MAG: hypothetical protein Aurels2KO_31880 [Aureliella sp.]
MREKLRWLLIAGLAATPLSASAQEHEFPALNSLGRFLGVGYSNTGYHGRRDGRFDVIKARQPSHYASSGLSYPYDPAYRPYRPARVTQAPIPGAQQFAAPSGPTAAPELPSDEPEEIKPEEVKPAKPVGPPPQWLKPHLKDTDEEAIDSSPSDRRLSPDSDRDDVYGELTPPRQPSSRAESPFYIEPEEVPGPEDVSKRQLESAPQSDSLLNDSLLDGDDSLLDSEDEGLLDSSDEDLLLDDDDLLLDEDDLSVRRYLRSRSQQPRTATKPGGKVSVLQSPIPSVSAPQLTPSAGPPARGVVQLPGPQFRPQAQQARQPVQYRTPARVVATSPNQTAFRQQAAPRFVGTPRPAPGQQMRPAQPAGPYANQRTAAPTRRVPGYVVSHQAPARQQSAGHQQATGYRRPAAHSPAQPRIATEPMVANRQTLQQYRPSVAPAPQAYPAPQPGRVVYR